MAALLPASSSLSSALRQQSTSLPLRLGSSSNKPFSTSLSSVSRLGQHGQHENRTRQPSLSTASQSLSRLSIKTSPYTSQTSRSITVQARPPQSSPTPVSKSLSKHKQSSPGSIPPQPAEQLPLTNLPYFIRRTPSNQLPVYIVTKSGGTRQQTKIQKTEGDLEALRTDLARALGFESSGSSKSPDVFINRLNGHVVVKGWRKPEIVKFLSDRKF